MGVFTVGKVQENSFRPPKKHELTKQVFWCTGNLHDGCLDYSEIPSILLSGLSCEYSGTGTEKSKIFGSSLDKEVENLADHGCPKI